MITDRRFNISEAETISYDDAGVMALHIAPGAVCVSVSEHGVRLVVEMEPADAREIGATMMEAADHAELMQKASQN